jgi:two-component system sensor histidine kinase TctE
MTTPEPSLSPPPPEPARSSWRERVRRWWRSLPWVAPGDLPLRRYLLIWLLTPQLVLWLAAALVSYQVAARYANMAIDRSLYQASRALAKQVKPTGSGLLIDLPRAARDIIESDPDEQVYYMVSTPPGQFILGNTRLPEPPQSLLLPGGHAPLDEPRFYDAHVKVGDKPVAVRVVALYLGWSQGSQAQTMLVQMAKSRVGRDALAGRILGDIAIPLVLLMLLMSVIVWASLRKGLAPLARLRQAVLERPAGDLTPIDIGKVPEEIDVLASAINGLLAAVQDSVTSQGRFISDAAHQLRTPLAGLKGQTELALKATADPELKARLNLVHESATRSAHLVNQLLTLARAEPESRALIGRSRFDLRRLVSELTAEMVPRALQAHVDLGMHEDDGADAKSLQMEGNALLIREALFNVIDNAIRYAGAGAEVTVSAGADEESLWLQVDDTGPGIDPAFHEAVFQRFFRATHQGTGCGLGLAIVQEIVARHGGTVRLQSRTPHGLSVRLSFPLRVST